MTWTKQDYQFMSRAIQLAKRGQYTCDPNPRVGCVIVKDNQVQSEGWHVKAGEGHAEVNALANCDNPRDSSIYISLEPCSHQGRTPACTDALIEAKPKEVVIAMVDPNPSVSGSGVKALEQAGITVRQGLMETQAKKLNPGFIKRMSKGLPFIRVKLAMSLDSRTALANGESQWITSNESRKDVHKLRAACSAIVTTAETVIKDDPQLNARELDFEIKQPLRIIIDRQLKTLKSARLFEIEDKLVIYTKQKNNNAGFDEKNVDIVELPASRDWLRNVFSHLATEYEINNVMVEAGSTFNGALMDAGLVDEVILYLAPKFLGQDAQPLLNLDKINELSEAKEFMISDLRQIGSDLRLTLSV